MTGLEALWLPILLSAVLVFVVSSIIHMGPLWHRNDYPKMDREDEVRAALRPLAIPPGEYMVPRCAANEMNSPEFKAKLAEGPNMIVTVLPNRMMPFGRTLALWFVNALLVSLIAAYIAGRALPPGAEYLDVFRFAGTTAFVGYAVALWQMSIWYARSWGLTLRLTVDGLIYGLVTAGVFGWLWPA